MPSQTKRAATDIAAETLAMEEVALCTESFHHIDPLGAEVADVAAAKPRREVLTLYTLGRETGRIREKKRMWRCEVRHAISQTNYCPAGRQGLMMAVSVHPFVHLSFQHLTSKQHILKSIGFIAMTFDEHMHAP